MILSERVSARAIRATELIGATTRPADTSVSHWLAQDGLQREANSGENEWMSFAHAMIQHASGYYGAFNDAEGKLTPELLVKIRSVLGEIDQSVRSGAIASNGPILTRINQAFPTARLSVKVVDANTSPAARPYRPIESDCQSKANTPKGVLLVWNDNRFEAVVADHAIVSTLPPLTSQKAAHELYDANFSRALQAAKNQ